jgi:stage II sporulation protein D
MRFLPTPTAAALALLLAVPALAAADTIRVAVARGATLRVEGTDLVARTGLDGPLVPLGRASNLEAVGPFVSTGETLAASVTIEDRAGGPVRIGGVTLLGAAEIVGGDAGLLAVDVVDVETYVASVVGSEMSASWPAQALQAQAIAARTYVLKKKLAAGLDAPFHVEASVLHQVYKGAQSVDARTRAAAEATRGQVLTWEGQLADAFFFASCRGRTETSLAAFGAASPYLQPSSCEGGESAPKLRWVKRMPLGRASRWLQGQGAIGDELTRIDVVSRTGTGRVASARLVTRHGGRVVTGAELRRLFGYAELPSLDVTIAAEKGELVFTGAGAGHGVGLCQWCARGRALAGDTAEEILARAYPGTTLTPSTGARVLANAR